MKKQLIKKIEKIVGPDQFTTASEELLCYSYDGTGLEYLPKAVAFPETVETISAIMRLADEEAFPVVVRGAGTGMTGGSLPVSGGLVLAMSRMNHIIEIDTDNQIAVVEPGVVNGRLQAELTQKGLYYPPDPASLKFCTIGGNVAECAGGPSAVKYGVTRDYVLGLEVVLPDGRIINTGVRTAKGVVGYDLTRLFVGSEGTLGIITKIILRVLAKPTAKKTFLVLSSSLHQATSLVCRILASHQPCTLEYMDRTALGIVKELLPFSLPDSTEALLLIEVDGDELSVAAQAGKLKKFLDGQENLLVVKEAATREDVEYLWKARRSISPAAFQIKPNKISEDVVVPRSRIPDLVAFTEKLAKRHDLLIFTFGHAGDGNIHVNIMVDRENSAELKQARVAKKALFVEVIRLGGTLSGEHGIGLTKADYLLLELSPATLEALQQIKNLFDPKNILNPGKIFPQKK